MWLSFLPDFCFHRKFYNVTHSSEPRTHLDLSMNPDKEGVIFKIKSKDSVGEQGYDNKN